MIMLNELRNQRRAGHLEPVGGELRLAERGAGVVEWLGISALSIGLLVVIFAAMESLGLDVVAQIRSSLGL